MARALILAAALALSACASGPTPDGPKANPLARAKILSANEKSIAIEHSNWGKSIAFRWAADHCAKFGKAAVPIGATQELVNTVSTWRCE